MKRWSDRPHAMGPLVVGLAARPLLLETLARRRQSPVAWEKLQSLLSSLILARRPLAA
ncbi:hypothetical protein Dimus_018295, partial [Dionaea muscipula]